MSSYFTGEFGSVMEGNLKQQDGTSLKVAVKTMKCELLLMKHLPAGVGSWGSNLVFCKASEGGLCVKLSVTDGSGGHPEHCVVTEGKSPSGALHIFMVYTLYSKKLCLLLTPCLPLCPVLSLSPPSSLSHLVE